MIAQPVSRRTLRLPTLNLWFDSLLLVEFAAVITTAFVNIRLHIWLGLASIPTLAVHLWLHRALITTLVKQLWRRELRLRWKWLLDVLLFVMFVLLIFSGMLVAVIYAPRVSSFHENAFAVFAVLVALHLFSSRKWIASKLHRRSRRAHR